LYTEVRQSGRSATVDHDWPGLHDSTYPDWHAPKTDVRCRCLKKGLEHLSESREQPHVVQSFLAKARENAAEESLRLHLSPLGITQPTPIAINRVHAALDASLVQRGAWGKNRKPGPLRPRSPLKPHPPEQVAAFRANKRLRPSSACPNLPPDGHDTGKLSEQRAYRSYAPNISLNGLGCDIRKP
jgi:hypothetical protein